MILGARGAPATAGLPSKERLAQTAPSAGPLPTEASSFNQTLTQLTTSPTEDTPTETEAAAVAEAATEPGTADSEETGVDSPALALPDPALLLAFAPGAPSALPNASGEAAAAALSTSAAVSLQASEEAAAEPVAEAQNAGGAEKDVSLASSETPFSEAAFAAALAGTGADPAVRSRERAETAERVTGPVQAFFREMPDAPGTHEIILTLTPDSLGELKIHVTTTADGEVRAAIIAATPEAKAALETSIEGLRHTLTERGLKLENFSVTLPAPESSSGAAGSQMFLAHGGSGQGQQEAFRPGFAAFRGYRQDDSSVEPVLPLAMNRWSAWDGINLLV